MIHPHLPVQSCSIKNHERWKRIKVLAVVVFFSLFAGGVSAMIVLGWIWPSYGGDNWVITQQNRVDLIQEQPNGIIFKEMKERFFSVYGELSSLDTISYLNQKSKLGDAVSVGSDGWLAVYLPEAKSFNNYKKWRILGVDKILYKVDSALYDAYTHLAYFKIISAAATSTASQNGIQIKVVGFAEGLNINEHLSVFVNNNWHNTQLGELWKGIFTDTHLDSAVNYAYDLSGGPFKPGTIVMNNRGRLAGFVTNHNRLLPYSAISRILPQVLSQKKIIYPSFGVAGWFGDEQPIITVDGESISGFAVKDVWSGKSVLQRGDIILEINGQAVTNENLWYNLEEDMPLLKVLRRGRTIELKMNMLQATPQSYIYK